MDPIDIDDATGWVTVTIAGTSQRLDLWAVNGKIADLVREAQGQPGTTWLANIAAYMADLGFPGVNLYTAKRFAESVWDRVGDVRKNEPGGQKPDSPASTESTPGS